MASKGSCAAGCGREVRGVGRACAWCTAEAARRDSLHHDAVQRRALRRMVRQKLVPRRVLRELFG